MPTEKRDASKLVRSALAVARHLHAVDAPPQEALNLLRRYVQTRTDTEPTARS